MADKLGMPDYHNEMAVDIDIKYGTTRDVLLTSLHSTKSLVKNSIMHFVIVRSSSLDQQIDVIDTSLQS